MATDETMMYKEWEKALSAITESDKFKSELEKSGYFLSPEKSFRKYMNEWGMFPTTNAANFLSKDFWHQQSWVLTDKNYYIIRTGKGSFAIFDEKRFPRPYLNLNSRDGITELSETFPDGFNHLKSAFSQSIIENTGLEQLRFDGVYDKMIESVTGKIHEFYIGVRGNTTRTFDIFFRNIGSEIEKIRSYTGQADLDYTLWTNDSVFLFEAKKAGREGVKRYLDIGWHKFAYAATRFINYTGLKIYPVYFLRNPTQVFLFVFPKFKFHEKGIILNDAELMLPDKAFVVNFDTLDDTSSSRRLQK